VSNIKKFKDFDILKYFKIGDFETKIEIESPTYGKYYMTKTLSVDMISATEDSRKYQNNIPYIKLMIFMKRL
jgi:hypothetical protein